MDFFEVAEAAFLGLLEKTLDEAPRSLFFRLRINHLDDFARELPENFRSRPASKIAAYTGLEASRFAGLDEIRFPA